MKLRILAITLITICNYGCNKYGDKEGFTEFIDSYYIKYESGDYDSIVNLGDSDFNKTTTKREYIEYINNINNELGKHKSHSLTSWQILREVYGNPRTIFLARYKVIYEKGESSEEFTLIKSDGKIKIRKYRSNRQ